MTNIYKQVVHWKAIFFTLPRMTGIKFTDTLNEILSTTTLNDSNAETAMYCAMVMPHLILARLITSMTPQITKPLQDG